MLVIPAQINDRIDAFAQRIGNSAAVRISVLPSSDARKLDCGANVDRAIAKDGGVALKGYRVWWIPNVLIEAQAHVVWQQINGTVIDITPNGDNETECVFIPDSSMNANPGVDYVPSRHENLTDSSDVDRYITCARVVSDHRDRESTTGMCLEAPPEALELVTLLRTLAGLAAERRG